MARYIDIESKEATHLVCNLEPRWKPMPEFNGEDFEELNSIAEAFLALPTADVAPKSEVAKELLSDLKKAVHDKAVYPHNEEFAFINLRVFDTVIQSYLKKYAESDP